MKWKARYALHWLLELKYTTPIAHAPCRPPGQYGNACANSRETRAERESENAHRKTKKKKNSLSAWTDFIVDKIQS